MSSHTYDYLDGNAAAGELSKIFAMDVTTAEAQCAHCGATKRFAEAHVYMRGPGLVARCAVCEHVLLRLVNVRQRVFLDLRGMTYLILDASQLQDLQDLYIGTPIVGDLVDLLGCCCLRKSRRCSGFDASVKKLPNRQL